jgi:excisionase family DNA binding protein
MPEMLTKYEVSRLLKVSTRAVERLVKQGRIPRPVQLSGRTIRFRSTDIQRFLDGSPPTEEAPDGTSPA